MWEQGRDLYDWIQHGAYVYVCGEKTPMSVEVEKTLVLIFEQYGGLSKQAAEKYFDQLKEEGRYSKDVY
jgi:sulfite reductase (NADPH) flavoprotein alpha-component